MLNIMNRLGPRDLANFSGSCRALRVLSRQAVPGLHLTLYPHQVGTFFVFTDVKL